MRSRHYYSSALLLLCSLAAYGQGCSDAGFCTIGTMKGGLDTAVDNVQQSSVGLSITGGYGEHGVLIISPQLEASRSVGRHGVLEGKLPYNIASGNLGHHSGIGDPLVVYSHMLTSKPVLWRLAISGGVRIGINKADAMDRGHALPMPYQSGLGTTDIIAGVGAKFRHWLDVAIGYQQPLWQYNNNGYLPATLYPSAANDSVYFASNRLRRKGDVLLRAEASLQWHRWAASTGPLLIWHLGEDRITLANGCTGYLQGSDGITLNLSGTVTYSVGKMKLQLVAGTPFVVRNYRPDGLTRAWVTTLRYQYYFH
jgi:hypothetical protein